MAILLALVVALGGCAVSPTPPPSPAQEPSPAGSDSSELSSSIEPTAGDPIGALVAALQASGATVTDLGSFNPDPLDGRGARLCVAGQQISVYVYETEAERAAAAGGIDPTDPTHIGKTIIVEWAGNPTFWERDLLIVLYLGDDPAVKAGLTAALGQPFASGQGRDPGPDRHAC